jgi:hypothetical protein
MIRAFQLWGFQCLSESKNITPALKHAGYAATGIVRTENLIRR